MHSGVLQNASTSCAAAPHHRFVAGGTTLWRTLCVRAQEQTRAHLTHTWHEGLLASIASMRGDPPSVTGEHAASKKRPRDEDEDDRVSLQELVDSLMA